MKSLSSLCACTELTSHQNGQLVTTNRATLGVEDESLAIGAIRPLSDSAGSKVSIFNAVLHAAEIADASSITAQSLALADSLSVAGYSELKGDVTVGGALTCHGPVVGSGPYVDSSDRRLKTDVRKIDRALETIQQLHAVSGFSWIELDWRTITGMASIVT